MLKKILPQRKDYKGKLMPNQEWPCVIKKTFFRGALILSEIASPKNLDPVKKYLVKTSKGDFEKQK